MIRFVSPVICACLTLVGSSVASADDIGHDDSVVSVEAASVSPAKIGETAQLQFTITNNGNTPVNLMSVRSHLAQRSRMTIFDPYRGRQEVSDLTVQRDETLDLASSHIRVELIHLTREIEPGSTIEFELVFRKFSTTADAHVR